MAGNTIDEIFAALINEGEEVKTAGEEVKPEEEAKVEGEKKPEAEKVAALAEILPEEALNVLREYVKEAEEEEKKAEQVSDEDLAPLELELDPELFEPEVVDALKGVVDHVNKVLGQVAEV